MSDFKAITTQEELESIVKARVAREREKFSDYDQLKTKVADFEAKEANYQSTIESLKTEKTELSGQIDTLNGELKQTKVQSLRQRMATEYGLPLDLADRLQGEDEDSLKADAESLSAVIKPPQPTPPAKSNEPTISDSKEVALKEVVRNLTNKGD
ncbi:phage protein [Streptococcus varani]|uniref:Phage protein n=1 Tax=Streptococcus varani TaxID=1608583 RepID=A0A0E4CTM7_9STRE|nr:DUF4355 domain-containing protein [Streptococcus varani]CQR25879.1 phage protein [Streptococcus varani]